MSKGFRFELNEKGVGELLHSDVMAGVLMQYAAQVSSTAGAGYKAKQLDTRVVVVADTQDAEQDNYENNTLLKAMG